MLPRGAGLRKPAALVWIRMRREEAARRLSYFANESETDERFG